LTLAESSPRNPLEHLLSMLKRICHLRSLRIDLDKPHHLSKRSKQHRLQLLADLYPPPAKAQGCLLHPLSVLRADKLRDRTVCLDRLMQVDQACPELDPVSKIYRMLLEIQELDWPNPPKRYLIKVNEAIMG